MPDKTQVYAQLAAETARGLTESLPTWTAFLETSARLYKYPYQDQLLIFAQRPDATACADYDVWNKTMRRYIRRGSKGIALLDSSGDQARLRYVFDISDTGGNASSRQPNLWEFRPEHLETVAAGLDERFDVTDTLSIANQMETVAAHLLDDYWIEHSQEILDIVDSSALGGYDADMISEIFRFAGTVSTNYMVMSRCGLDPKIYYAWEDFHGVLNFDTPEAVAALGTAVSGASEQILRQIEATIKRYDREHIAERSQEHGRTELREERGLSDPGSEVERTVGRAAGQVRQDETDLSPGTPSDPLQQSGPVREAVPASEGDRPDSERTPLAPDAEADAGSRDQRNDEGREPDAVGRSDEQLQGPGGGDDPSGAGVQLNDPASEESRQFSFFPSEAEQREEIAEAELVEQSTSAFSVSQGDLKLFLIHGSNEDHARQRIANEFSNQKPIAEKTAFLKTIYRGAYGIETKNGRFSMFAAEDGLHIAPGSEAEHVHSAHVVSWNAAAAIISNMLDQGRFLTNVELAEAPGYERTRIADALLYLSRDLSQYGQDAGLLSYVRSFDQNNYPENQAALMRALEDPILRNEIARDFRRFFQEWKHNTGVLRFHYHRPAEIMQALEELSSPRVQYTTTLSQLPEIRHFITEDDISDALRRGSHFANGKNRIHDFWEQPHTLKDKLDFLRQEYGIGGGNNAFSHNFHASIDFSGKGMSLAKPFCNNVNLSWSQVVKRLDQLISQDRYLTDEEKAVRNTIREAHEEIPEEDAWADIDPAALHITLDDGTLYQVGDVVTIDGTPYTIMGIGAFDIQLLEPDQSYPIFRAESHESFRAIMMREQQRAAQSAKEETSQPTQPQYTSEVVSTYTAEQTRLPYDIVVERLHVEEPVLSQAESAAAHSNPAAAQSAPIITSPIQPPPENFRITDPHLGEGGPKEKFRRNVDAIRLLKDLESDGRSASPEEQETLSRYVGWGGLSDAFDAEKDAWASEYQELRTLLTEEEYAAARASTLNAHYTSPTVIKAVYDVLGNMGFKNGNILEPSMGIGNFFGMLPEEMQGSRLYGVELDSVSGRIAKQLYPQADITIAGFETTSRKDFYDVAIGNVPFGNYQVNDRAYNRLGFSTHNYFFAKALDQVRPGGVVAFVTSRYTMDAKDPTVRKYLSQRADLLGAIRLPNNAFRANAGTDVVSDIIFLQKRETPSIEEPDWVHLGQNDDGFAINSYFVDHPEMILGRQASESTQYGHQDFTVEPIEGLELTDQLEDAVKYIQGTYQDTELPDLGEEDQTRDTLPADPNVKNFSFTVIDGEVYYRENSIMVRPSLTSTAKERTKGLVALRDCVNELIALEMDDFSPTWRIEEKQGQLNRLYDSFSAKYGLINDRANRLAFSDDSSYYLLCSLEILDEDNKLERKADIFTKRTIKQQRSIEHVDTAVEALAVSIGEKTKVDLEYMADLMGGQEKIPQIVDDLRGIIFKDPSSGPFDPTMANNSWRNGWQTADEYLSGNVRKQLRAARRAAENDPFFRSNVAALEKAQPKDLDASEIEVRVGSTWIDKDIFQQFMYETFDTPFYLRYKIRLEYSPVTAEWHIENKHSVLGSDVAAYNTYGTFRANAYEILEDTLNLRDVRIYDTVKDGDGKERRVLNSKETTLAAQKQQAIKDAFRDWIWKDPQRRQKLVAQYNELMNSTRPREYDGSHLTFAGMNPEITLRDHQKNAIAHIIYGGNTLLAHEVGAGKTFEMIAAAMESKRLGLCNKSIIVVPNHLTDQWASEFLRLYPSANILVTTKKDFETKNRKKFCSRIATGDYDAVIIGHSQFEKIPISKERQERLLRDQIDDITNGLEELRFSRSQRFTVKQLEKTKRSLEARLRKLEAEDRKDDVITFEQLGVDRMFVDESDNYKNLFLYTKMRNVAGLSTTDAQKSSDMFAKCRYMDEITGSRGTVFATGTPISNSMTELYTVQRYLQYDRLQELGMGHFDCWASRFGETTTALELAPEGTGYRARTRFAKFFNLPELMNLFKEVADIKTADQLHLPTPAVEYHNYASKPTEIQQAMVQELSKRATVVHKGGVDARTDNMLKITSDGRKLGLDQRVVNPMLPDETGTKVNQCVENILQFWKDGESDKLTQLVFCDLSTPQAKTGTRAKKVSGALDNPLLHAIDADFKDSPPEQNFTIYDDIRRKLIEGGMPPEQIAFIHDADTEVKKRDLFAKVRAGQVRVLMGSTAKMGAGTNVQDRLIALHDLDAPWRPRDLIQRKGRIERQGNKNETVHVCRYVTEGTFDAYLWQTLETKQRFISQIMTSKSPVRSCEDVDETALSFAEIKALCAGDPRIKERMDLDVEVSRLKLLKADHQSKQFRLEDMLLKTFPQKIEENKGYIRGFENDLKMLEQYPLPNEGFVGMEVRGDVLTEKDNAGAALLDAVYDVKTTEPVDIGHYRGFTMQAALTAFGQYSLTLQGEMSHTFELGSDPRGNLIRLENAIERIPERMKAVQAQLDNYIAQQEAAKEELGKPFPQEQELKDKSARLVELDMGLNLDGIGQSATEIAPEEPEEIVAKSGRPSVLEQLNSCKQEVRSSTPKHHHEQER